jgi:hypothetical protein
VVTLCAAFEKQDQQSDRHALRPSQIPCVSAYLEKRSSMA